MKEMIQIDFKFHKTIYRATKNNQLSQLLERILENYVRFWLFIPYEIPHQKFFDEAIKFIKAIQEKDESKVRESAEAHIGKTVDDLLDYFLTKNNYTTTALL